MTIRVISSSVFVLENIPPGSFDDPWDDLYCVTLLHGIESSRTYFKDGVELTDWPEVADTVRWQLQTPATDKQMNAIIDGLVSLTSNQ